MPSYNPGLQKARLSDVEPGRARDDLQAHRPTGRCCCHRGDLRCWGSVVAGLEGYAGTELCELPHVALIQQGTLRVVARDGSQEDYSAGDVMLLPPGHDAWTVGDGRGVFVEFSRGGDYYDS